MPLQFFLAMAKIYMISKIPKVLRTRSTQNHNFLLFLEAIHSAQPFQNNVHIKTGTSTQLFDKRANIGFN
jgi:hypothetical protein